MSDWAQHGACRGKDQELFFPGTRGAANASRALLVCRRCPVVEECLDHALNHPEQFGVWGGKTEVERREMRRGQRKRQPQPDHGTAAGYDAHLRRGEKPCGSCQEGSRRERARRYQERRQTA